MPNGKRLMHSRINAKNGDVAITEDGLKIHNVHEKPAKDHCR